MTEGCACAAPWVRRPAICPTRRWSKRVDPFNWACPAWRNPACPRRVRCRSSLRSRAGCCWRRRWKTPRRSRPPPRDFWNND